MGGLILDGIVFDADGVLFDTENMGLRIWREVGQEINDLRPAQDYLRYVGRCKADNLIEMARLYGEEFQGESFFARCSERAMEIMETEGIPMKPGVYELLEFLKERNIPIALATSTYRERTMYRMTKAGLLPYFQVLTTGDEVVHSKPNPDIYQLACRRLGISTARAIAIEDSRNGILAATGAGMRAIMVPDLIPPTPDLDAILFRRCASLMEVQEYLASAL